MNFRVFNLFFRNTPQNNFARQKVVLAGMLSLGMLFSCETDVEMDIDPHTPRLAVEYNLHTEELDRNIFVSRSQSILSNTDLGQIGTVKNATVTIKEAGAIRQSFMYQQQQDFNGMGTYKPQTSLTPQPGRQYTLTVSAPGFETVEGQLTMPVSVPVTSGSFQADSKNTQFVLSGQLRVQFPDVQGQTNHYRVLLRFQDSQGNYLPGIFNVEEQEDVLGEDIQETKVGQAFSDVWAKNGVITISDRIEYYLGSNQPATIEVTLQHLTPDLYLYERSKENYEEDNPFAEPSNLHSNIRNGYGNFGGITTTKFIIRL